MNAQSNQRELLKFKVDSLTDAEIIEVLEYIAIMQTMNRQPGGPELFYRTLAGAFFKAKDKPKARALRH